MRVLLLGATGNVGSRLVPSLVANKHQVVLYVRSPAKLSKEATSRVIAVESGSGTDGEKIKAAILKHNCSAVINAAGLANVFNSDCELPMIFQAVAKAALAAQEERGGPAIRCWFLSGFGILDSPKAGNLLINYVPIYPVHKPNYDFISHVPTDKVAWSLFCANYMPPTHKEVDYNPQAGAGSVNLVAGVDAPAAWQKTLQWVPLLGNWLNVLSQMGSYITPLEDCADFMAKDLSAGLDSPYIGKRVSVKSKPKSKSA